MQARVLCPNLKPCHRNFDTSHEIVEQLQAVSKDGTKVPYFVVRPRELEYGGSNPTLLTAYGGFQISNTPTYNAVIGKLWLERRGIYVVANIRGGGEFGPAWHEAGLKTHRHDLRRFRRRRPGPVQTKNHLAAPARYHRSVERWLTDGS